MKSQRFVALFALIAVIGFYQSVNGEFCYWDGTPPDCRGTCPDGFNVTKRDDLGAGSTIEKCWTGTKAQCCNKNLDDSCFWKGTAPFCTSGCPDRYEEIVKDASGDGIGCWSGWKSLCCLKK